MQKYIKTLSFFLLLSLSFFVQAQSLKITSAASSKECEVKKCGENDINNGNIPQPSSLDCPKIVIDTFNNFKQYCFNWASLKWEPCSQDAIQNLAIVGNSLSISNGNTVNLPISTYTAGVGINVSAGNVISNIGDLSNTNELQNLSLNAGVVAISGGNTITLPDASATNEIQNLTLSGANLGISGGVGITLPDASATNELQNLSWNSSSNLLIILGGNSVTLPIIQTINGLNTINQTFAVGAAGLAPAFSSAGSVHTLNIPPASAVGVTKGGVSNTDYTQWYNTWFRGGNPVTLKQVIGTTSNFDFGIMTNNIERFTFTTAGRFGLGVTTPSYDFSLKNNVGTQRIIGVENATGTNTSDGLIIKGGDAAIGSTDIGGNGLTFDAGNTTGTGSTSMSFKVAEQGVTGTATNTATTYLAINNSNSKSVTALRNLICNKLVGIGTTNPIGNLTFGGGLSTHPVTGAISNVRYINMTRSGGGVQSPSDLDIGPEGVTAGSINSNGGNLILHGGISTGNATSKVLIKTANSGSSGTTDNAYTTTLTIQGGATGESGVIFSKINSATAPTSGAALLGVDAGGQVVVASTPNAKAHVLFTGGNASYVYQTPPCGYGGASSWTASTETYDDTNSYNPTTNIFTAPSAGYYLFSLSFSTDAEPNSTCTTGGHSVRFSLQTNLQPSAFDSEDYSVFGSSFPFFAPTYKFTFILKMQAGEMTSLEKFGGTDISTASVNRRRCTIDAL
jgi:hypothetical protein